MAESYAGRQLHEFLGDHHVAGKRRLSLHQSLSVWRADLLQRGLEEINLSGDIAIAATRLHDFHGDSADRIITATALHLGAKLCTADSGIQ